MTKTKQTIGGKYRYPSMNSKIEQIIGHCYACQVTTKLHRQEPVKVTDTWDVIVVDFSAPYPDGHYNLMAMKREQDILRSRRPTQQLLNQPWRSSKQCLALMAPKESRKVTTNHRSTPENLPSLLKQQDFTINELPRNTYALMAKPKLHETA